MKHLVPILQPAASCFGIHNQSLNTLLHVKADVEREIAELHIWLTLMETLSLYICMKVCKYDQWEHTLLFKAHTDWKQFCECQPKKNVEKNYIWPYAWMQVNMYDITVFLYSNIYIYPYPLLHSILIPLWSGTTFLHCQATSWLDSSTELEFFMHDHS